MFDSTPVCPPDAVFGLAEEFKQDRNPDKINLTVGMYQDESGQTPVMDAVHAAEMLMARARKSHVYLPIDGLNSYNQLIESLILGNDEPAVAEGRVATAQTPGGTAALRVAGDLLYRVFDVRKIWISNPTWANHPQVFESTGLELKRYDYLDDNGTGLGFDSLIDSLSAAQPNDAILLHTVCHNPTGVDPTLPQWQQLLNLVKEKQLMPIFDFAYQGFGTSLEHDAMPIRFFCKDGGEAIICNSFSKNFSLYGERVGGITAVAHSHSSAQALLSQIKAIIRTTYSNPPAHGAEIVATILGDASLRAQWKAELDGMRTRIRNLRASFAQAISQRLPGAEFDHINRQRGMFSYSGITADHVDRLKNEFSIYMLRSGRINIAGINSNNIDRLCDGIASVLTGIVA